MKKSMILTAMVICLFLLTTLGCKPTYTTTDDEGDTNLMQDMPVLNEVNSDEDLDGVVTVKEDETIVQEITVQEDNSKAADVGDDAVEQKVSSEYTLADTTENDDETTPTIGYYADSTDVSEDEEETVPTDATSVKLTADKKMDPAKLTVLIGDKVYWDNTDTWPHKLAITTGSFSTRVIYAESPRMTAGDVWDYTFEEAGEYTVKDAFSGTMIMTVTVE